MSDRKGGAIRVRSRETLSGDWYKLEQVTFDQVSGDGSRQPLAREVYHNGPGAAVLPIDRAAWCCWSGSPAYLNGDADVGGSLRRHGRIGR